MHPRYGSQARRTYAEVHAAQVPESRSRRSRIEHLAELRIFRKPSAPGNTSRSGAALAIRSRSISATGGGIGTERVSCVLVGPNVYVLPTRSTAAFTLIRARSKSRSARLSAVTSPQRSPQYDATGSTRRTPQDAWWTALASLVELGWNRVRSAARQPAMRVGHTVSPSDGPKPWTNRRRRWRKECMPLGNLPQQLLRLSASAEQPCTGF